MFKIIYLFTGPRVFEIFPELSSISNRRVKTLSGGQQQMVAVARAIVLEPEVLIIDEPGAGLAPTVVDRLISVIVDMANSGCAVLIAEQDVSWVLEISQRAFVMADGNIVSEGESKDLLLDDSLRKAYLGI